MIGHAWRLIWYPRMWRSWRVVRTAVVTFYDFGPVTVEVRVRHRR
jgi:hypothetical protein